LRSSLEVRAKRASKDANMQELVSILRGPRKNAGTSGWRSLSGAVGIITDRSTVALEDIGYLAAFR